MGVLVVLAVAGCGRTAVSPGGDPAERSWTVVESGTERTLLAVAFQDTAMVWAVGEGGTAIESADGGVSWHAVDVGTDADLRAVAFAPDGTICIVGDGGTRTDTARGHILRGRRTALASSALFSRDGGVTWTIEALPTNFLVHCVRYVPRPGGAVWVAGASGGRNHPDGDLHIRPAGVDGAWHYRSMGMAIHDLFVLPSGMTWVAGFKQTVGFREGRRIEQRARTVRSRDFGENWVLRTPMFDGHALGVCFVSDDLGWVVGDGGAVVRTTDAGEGWEAQVSGVDENLHAAVFLSPGTGWVVGAGGTLLFTKDGGDCWERIAIQTGASLLALGASSDGTLLAVGEGGTIVRSGGE